MNILPVIARSTQELTAIFRDLHAHPEIGFTETRTAGIVADKLRAYGIAPPVGTSGGRRAKRDKIADATDFMGWYMDGSEKGLGISKYDARNQYLAYHEGRTGFAKGSYNAKSWLLDVAQKVENRSQTYALQLRACGRG